MSPQNQGWIVPESSLISLTDSISSIASGLRAPAPGCPSPVTGLKKCWNLKNFLKKLIWCAYVFAASPAINGPMLHWLNADLHSASVLVERAQAIYFHIQSTVEQTKAFISNMFISTSRRIIPFLLNWSPSPLSEGLEEEVGLDVSLILGPLTFSQHPSNLFSQHSLFSGQVPKLFVHVKKSHVQSAVKEKKMSHFSKVLLLL